MPVEVMAILMFLTLMLLLLLGIPVFVALFLVGIIFGSLFWGIEQALATAFNGLWSIMNNWGFVAVPLFIFTAVLLESCGIVDEMYKTFYIWLGRFRGSLFIITMLLGIVIGAMTGIIGAGISTLGLILYPQMLKFRYPKNLSMGIVMFAGCLPQLIPPSLNAVIYGMTVGVSVGKLFAGGLATGLIMATLGIIYSLIQCQLHKNLIPVINIEAMLKEKLLALKGIIPPIIIILGILGSIFSGLATPTEAAGVGAFITLLYAFITRRITRENLMRTLRETLVITTMICWIAAGGLTFGSVFSACGGRGLISSLMLSLPYPQYTVLALSIILLFVLGFFIDSTTIIIVFGPILAPIIHALGYDPVWWGVIFCVMLIASYLTPPMAPAMFYFKAVRPEESMEEIIKAGTPFAFIVLIVAIVAIIFPEVIIFFVKLFYGT